MKDRDTPLRLVRTWEKIAPGVYDVLDDLKDANGTNDLHWPSFCDLPIGAAASLISAWGFGGQMVGAAAAELTACYIWRKNKVIYSFDDDFSYMLAVQADNFKDLDTLPVDALIHPPYPCMYIKTKTFKGAAGFWYWVEYDMNTNGIELRVQFVAEDMRQSIPFVLHLLPGKTIQECLRDTVAEIAKHTPRIDKEPTDDDRQNMRYVLAALQFILYIVSANADIQDVPQKATTRVEKRKKQILDKASEVKEKSAGARIGNAIRKSRVASHPSLHGKTGIKVKIRPHSRRGHWHHYWVGPKDGERSLVLKWVAPTFIHQEAFRNDSVVVFPIKQ